MGDTRAENADFFGLFERRQPATGGAKLPPPPLDGAENGALVVAGLVARVVVGAAVVGVVAGTAGAVVAGAAGAVVADGVSVVTPLY
ncbi:MAG: hypothetical protein FGM42_11350, partial [Ilumatobacteraceae bacterium]|nr:hypothetical protein [Ilumatobacteraceae bacterium]